MKDLDQMLDKLSAFLKPVVEAIEAEPELTKNRYDRYMTIIPKVVERVNTNPEMHNKMALAVGAAMIRAGGNRDGVHSALKIMEVIKP